MARGWIEKIGNIKRLKTSISYSNWRSAWTCKTVEKRAKFSIITKRRAGGPGSKANRTTQNRKESLRKSQGLRR